MHSLSTAGPPQNLSHPFEKLFSRALDAPPDFVQRCWTALKEQVWHSSSSIAFSEEDILTYNTHAHPLQLSYRHIYPPVKICTTKECPHRVKSKPLVEPLTHPATLFTLREGALPVFTTSLYCRGCNIRYYHNYSVHKASETRTYYGGVPDIIHVTRHYLFETALLEHFATSKVFAWVSSLNCARIYNSSMASLHAHILNNELAHADTIHLYERPPSSWPTSMDIRGEYVLDGFFLYSLLLDKAEHGAPLVLKHDEANKDRLKKAIHDRNKQTEGTGQEFYPHACDDCFMILEDENVKIHPAVCDGITLGHPCCAIHNCKDPLPGHRGRFCVEHAKLFDKLCAVLDCEAEHRHNRRTCPDVDHAALEDQHIQRGKAMFQLRAKLKRANISVPLDSAPDDGATVVHDQEDEIEVEVQSTVSKKKLKAIFGRRRTHNEQLIMRPCGIIISRATFYGAEAITDVNTFAKATFPTPQSTPEFFIFDNNCQLHYWQKANHETHFENTGQPVDVFHFKSKHKESDTHCQTYCNPAAFPELIDGDKWRVNTSICEQSNVWLGGYQAILRDMEGTRFNFYLDEMIKRRNSTHV
ncbi:hypothetical protein NLJ89_g9787 [Agrocybe chaxingu]|uniref:CxC5 like cysteine cluster associated with KDZ domain-containing protein n=1 Tax=Agrocybe chaxingu TaxID=84603 RepID=A0A9W8MT77_9AGAR|nr:hypothetical protein NLJ89_g9787 [Agrocybe chaxingu]